mgnify:CR=1 FL=1
MGNLGRIGVAAPLLLAMGMLHASELSQKADRLYASGIPEGAAAQMSATRLQQGGVRVVVFEDATGGSAEVAEAYAQAIQAAGVETEVIGQCHAACAYAFLSGRSHRFGEGEQVNALLIPVATRPGPDDLRKRWRGNEARRTLTDFAEPGAHSASATTVSSTGTAGTGTAASRWGAEHGLLFTSSPPPLGPIFNTYYCDGSQGRDFTRCELLPDADPRQLGILSD